MLSIYQKILAELLEDDLLVRVIIFITGFLVGAIPIAFILFSDLTSNYDAVIYILLVLLTVLATFLIYASACGSKSLLEKAGDWANSGDLLFFLGLVTFAIPITLLIRQYQKK